MKKILLVVVTLTIVVTLCALLFSCSETPKAQDAALLSDLPGEDPSGSQETSSTATIEATPDDYFRFALLKNDTYEISARYQDMPPETIIPASYKGKAVTSIAKEGFKERTSVDIIDIPTSVTTIGESAFYGCTFLETVNASNNIINIGESAFYGCTSLKNFSIPKELTRLEARLFLGCQNLSNISIPDGVTYIGDYAFASCYSLQSISIPNKVGTLGDGAFSGCMGLITITLSGRPFSMGDNAFEGCYKLIEICNKSGMSILKGKRGIGYYAKNIYSEEGNSKLTKDENGFIIFEDDGYCALMGYVGTNSEVALPNGITEIYLYAFLNCQGLTAIDIPNGVVKINNHAFYNCANLTAITIPKSVITIDNSAFYNSSLTSITYQGTMEDWNSLFGDRYYVKSIYCSDGVIER